MIVGQKVRFELFHDDRCADIGKLRTHVTGTIVAIYPKGRWFSVEYNGQRTSFKVSDVGSVVTLIG